MGTKGLFTLHMECHIYRQGTGLTDSTALCGQYLFFRVLSVWESIFVSRNFLPFG